MRQVLHGYISILLLTLTACALHTVSPTSNNPSTWLIDNVEIYDGSGGDNYSADIRIENGLISAIAPVIEPRAGERIWKAEGYVISPGFIDPHSHHDSKLMQNAAPASVLAQGITTIVSGLDGSLSKFGESFVSVADNMAVLEQSPVAINVAFFAPHNNYRVAVMGEDYKRLASGSEIRQMSKLLAQDMEAGALGLSTGLEYEPAIYSNTEEVIALAKVAASYGGKYSSHIRSEDVAVTEAFEEVITIAREAGIPANISHIKLAMSALFGDSPAVLTRLNAARAEGLDITADIYPYDGWQSTLAILIPSRDFTDRAAAEFALTSIAAPTTIIFTRHERDPSYIGKTLAEVAEQEKIDPVDLLMKLLQTSKKEGKHISIIGRNIGEQDILNFMRWPYTAFTTDGGIDDRHPRGQGTFPRVLGRYVRERSALSLTSAIRKMTSLPAKNLGLLNRGLIKVGHAADLVVFDASSIIDHATFDDPIQYSSGVKAVWVNGVLVWENDAETGSRSGQVLRRKGTP